MIKRTSKNDIVVTPLVKVQGDNGIILSVWDRIVLHCAAISGLRPVTRQLVLIVNRFRTRNWVFSVAADPPLSGSRPLHDGHVFIVNRTMADGLNEEEFREWRRRVNAFRPPAHGE